MYIIILIFYSSIFILMTKCIPYNVVQSNPFKQHYSCIELSKNNIEHLIQQSDLIIAGRLKYHNKNEKYKQIHSNDTTDINTTHNTTTTTTTTNNTTYNTTYNDDIYFNITVFIKTIYKINHLMNNNEIIIGPMFISNSNNRNGTGCLTEFYSNAKYIFFLKNNNNNSTVNYYHPLSEAIEYTEYIEKKIYGLYCHNCVKPTIQSIPNQVLEYGHSLTTSCLATGTPTPTIMWIRDGKSINLADKGLTVETFERSPGYVESILEINNLILIDTGEYWCYAENALGLAKEKFTLKVQSNNRTEEKLMVDELIPCSDEDKDYCLNGGQCYTYKNERVSFQCRCLDHYFGDRCHFHTDGLYAYSESRGNNLQSILHELITTLTLRGIFFTLFGSSISILIFYGLWKCQQLSMHRRHLRRRKKSLIKHNSQMKTSHPVNRSNHGSRINSTVKDSTAPILISDFNTRDQKIENIPVAEDYFGQTGGSYILSAPNLVNSECYENRSQNFTGDVMIDLKSPLSTSHVNPQQLHDHSRSTNQFGYRPSSSLDQCNESVHKPENGITLNNRPFGTDWSTRRFVSQTAGSIRDRLPVLAEGSNFDLNVKRYPDYTDPIDNMNRFDRNREIPLNMVSSSSSFMQTNT
ncbi:unnamed protein product [Schistosoma rodhaini]|uniref:Ig-like domain-containing protein n=1 Tax=Schistosoma rodhaini TaxID=6188 RepID=A0AA85GAR1_9TREM|nr:unnamed protein product [Schistosoma rodhaini]